MRRRASVAPAPASKHAALGAWAMGLALTLATSTGWAQTAPSGRRCGDDERGFSQWLREFRREARAAGFRASVLADAFSEVTYQRAVIRFDRSQPGMKLPLDEFLAKRGAPSVIRVGARKRRELAPLLGRLRERFGVPSGPLLAIWGMESSFGEAQGEREAIAALATLAYDCRRSALFEGELRAALTLLQANQLTLEQLVGAGHGELGQAQFLPSNYIRFGVDGDGDRRVDMVGSSADALASVANYLHAHGWVEGAGYQPGEANFDVLATWNRSRVYQEALAHVAAAIDAAATTNAPGAR